MRTDPFTDTIQFLIGATSDHEALGALRYVFVALFIAMILGSLFIARAVWRADVAQQTARHVWTWFFRFVMGAMWFQGSTWKLPLPVSSGLQYWTEQMAQHAAFPLYADLVRNVVLKHMAIVDPVALIAELGMATSFMLGIAVRPVALLGIAYTIGLWVGLYRHPMEWPWTYVFIIIAHGQFIVANAGRSLGLDELLSRRYGSGRV